MDQEAQRYGDYEQLNQKPLDQEIVEFRSEMPRLDDDTVEFIADEELEEELADEI